MKFSHVLGAVTPGTVKTAAAELQKSEPKMLSHSMKTSFLPGILAGGAGAYAWKGHRVLGFIAGDAVGSRLYELYKGGNRKGNLADLAMTGGAVYASLHYKKHPILAFLGGALAGGVVTSFIEGSSAYRIRTGG